MDMEDIKGVTRLIDLRLALHHFPAPYSVQILRGLSIVQEHIGIL